MKVRAVLIRSVYAISGKYADVSWQRTSRKQLAPVKKTGNDQVSTKMAAARTTLVKLCS